MTLAQVLAELKALPGEVDSHVAQVTAEVVNVEESAAPVVDVAKTVFPQAAAIAEKYANQIEAEVNALVADLPDEAKTYVNKYLLPVETNLP